MKVYTSVTKRYDPHRGDLINVEPSSLFKRDRLNAKVPKILSHLFFEESTIWCDSNIFLTEQQVREIETKLETCDIVVMTHTNSIRKEAEACKIMKLDEPKRIDEQLTWYEKKELMNS